LEGEEHACIGFKFSELEMKVVLSTLLETLAFEDPNSEKQQCGHANDKGEGNGYPSPATQSFAGWAGVNWRGCAVVLLCKHNPLEVY